MNVWKILPLVGLILTACQSTPSKKETNTLFTLLTPKATGISFNNQLQEDERNNHLVNDMFVAGAGVAIGDINNDDLPDIYFAGNQVPDQLYLNKGDLKFEAISEQAGILAEGNWSAGVTMADVNNDGYLDIYVCKSEQENEQLSGNLLYINNGNGTFSEKAAAYNLADQGLSVQATFFDFDRDGWQDVYIVNQPPSVGKRQGDTYNLLNLNTSKYTNRLYWNKKGQGFQDITSEAGMLSLGYSLSAAVGDLNEDGWPDLYVTNDFDRPDLLYINQKDGTFKNRLDEAVKHISNFSMGSDIADYNNDGLLDIMVVDMVAEDHKRIKTYMGGMQPELFWQIVNNGWHYQYMFNTLQKNNGNGTFSEVAQLGGVSNTDWSWGPLFADFDNDGWKDLFVTNGIKRNQRHADLEKKITHTLDSLEWLANKKGKTVQELIDVMDFVQMAPEDRVPNYIYQNNGDLTFSKKVKEWGLDRAGFSYGAAYADLDMDGDLDLIVNNVDEPASIYRNNLQENQTGNNYLKIKVVDAQNSPAYGTRVKLFLKDGGAQMQELCNARGYMSKSEDVLHFGLGKNTMVKAVEITWPNQKKTILNQVKANQMLEQSLNAEAEYVVKDGTKSRLFKAINSTIQFKHRHQENSYNDFKREVLLPHKMSSFGPCLAVGDVNADGLEDFYVGGALGFSGALYQQDKNGSFNPTNQEIWASTKEHEDVGSLFFDIENDGDLDLYVSSGGNEIVDGEERLQDRLYLNDGLGNFLLTNDRLPNMLNSSSRVVAGDYDADGDLDLFVGGRLVPGKYPLPTKSYILRNDKGYFKDVTETIAPDLLQAGLVTDAVWTDLDGDDALDLVVVGEWMPVTVLENRSGHFTNSTESLGLQETTGWYYAVASRDMDEDGDNDLIVGNLGLNYKYKASIEEPFEIYSHDFDQNGQLDIVLSYHEHGEVFPVRGRSCSSEQIPSLAEKFPTYESFGDANLKDMYGEALNQAIQYQAQTFASAYIENKGLEGMQFRPLPNETQISSINSILIEDFNQDGYLDILSCGNLYPAEIETPRNDAGMGLLLTGNGKGQFEPVPLLESGFFAPYDAKDMKMIHLGPQKSPAILVGNNNFWMQVIQWKVPSEQSKLSRLE